MNTKNLLLSITAVVVSLVAPLQAQTAQPSLVTNRIVAPLDETSLVPLKGNVHPLAQRGLDRGAAPLSTPTGRIALLLERSAAQQQALTQYLADVQNPSSPSYHKWLTPAQYGAAYGVSDSDLETVESWLESHGFKVEKVPASRNLIQFSGTFDQVQSAFHTTIHTYSVNGATHFANATNPEIPAALAPVVAGLTPLNDFHPRPGYQKGPKGQFNPATHTIQPELTLGGSTLYVDPADAAVIYNTPNSTLNASYSGTSYDGTGVSIGIAGDSNFNMQDVQNYRTGFLNETSSNANLPTVVIEGNDPGINGDAIEALLDVEIAGALAPKAKVYFYTSSDTDISSGLFNAIFRAISDNTVSILNISFGTCEAAAGTDGNLYFLEMMEEAAAQGISVTVSTGDSGAAGCDNDNTETKAVNGFGINALASTPFSIAVGGTDFDVLGTNFATYVNSAQGSGPYYPTAKGYIPEKPWNNSTSSNNTAATNQAATNKGATNIVAAGGGSSGIYNKPAFQTSMTPNDNARDVPDVSLLAANGMYGAVWLLCADNQATGDSATLTQVDCDNTNGTFSDSAVVDGVGGTSAASPAFAGMLALVVQKTGARLGQADPVLYNLASTKYSTVFHDVTSGNNSVYCASGSANCGSNSFLTGYDAKTNYDLASGLGSVNVANLISNWSSAALTGTSTTLQINGSTAAINTSHGTPLTFNVGVTPTSATGAVAIVDTANQTAGGAVTGPQNNGQFAVSLTNGSGSASYNGLPGGTYTVSANYSGDSTHAGSSSSPSISVVISPEASTTSVAVNAYDASSGNSISTIPYGAQINLEATIAGTSNDEKANGTQGVATGTVTFINGSTTLGTASVVGAPNFGGNGLPGNLASWPPITDGFTVLPAGSYSVTAKYSGDSSFNTSTSAVKTFTVNKASTSTAASASPSSIASTATSTVTVTVTTPYNFGAAGYGSGPTGTVTLTGNGKTLATVTSFTTKKQSSGNFVMTGTATVNGSDLASGANAITVAYSGDANYASGSATLTLTVSGSSSAPAIGLSNSGNIAVAAGAKSGNTSTVTVTPSGGFTGAVALTCAVTTSITSPTSVPTCAMSPGSVTISGTTAMTSTLTVTTTAATTSALHDPLKNYFVPGGTAVLALVLFFGIPARRRAWRTMFCLLAIAVIFSAAGCGGKSGSGGGGGGGTGTSGTTKGAYTVTVTGTDAATGKVTSSTTISLTVS